MIPTIIENLVYVDESKPVTTSLMIAKTFEKEHGKVLRDIRSLECSENFKYANFGESSYENQQGRSMPMFIVSFDGFAMLAMGYTGKKAIEFKELYINEFNRTRLILASRNETLLSIEQRQLQSAIRCTINSLFPSVSTRAKMKYYSLIYGQLKKKFNVSSYRDITRLDLPEAIAFVEKWDKPVLDSRRCIS
ncbi:Rha family transcriptional regulator [Bacillus suaedae]|uniref:Rha family transcriptional regulator n=1 Tax=Halalkalibacter suaedae TaxID=2822140 RepID=A0A940WRT7_9BACI|nr:Rha family transcriptional regulator [Bacillus suaedae]MBP3951151.1 Rha family transcriptional regulator [Bacillus suaedae]